MGRTKLEKAIAVLELRRMKAAIRYVKEHVVNDTLEIDGKQTCMQNVQGVWVQCWAFVGNAEIAEYEDETGG